MFSPSTGILGLAEMPEIRYPRGYTKCGHMVTAYSEVNMCSPAKCGSCGKTTWTGCGEHIEEALEGVAQADRCTCN